MVEITKNEKNELEKRGCKWKEDLHRTYSNSPKYYLTESKSNLSKLKKIREEILCETYTSNLVKGK